VKLKAKKEEFQIHKKAYVVISNWCINVHSMTVFMFCRELENIKYIH